MINSQQDKDAECVICLIPDWEGPKHPDYYKWNVTFPADKPALLSLGWCATDKQTLDSNWSYMQYELVVDGYQIDLTQLTVSEKEKEDKDKGIMACRFYSGDLTGWASGRHSYTWIHHIYQSLNDGWDVYESGDYIMEFIVDVR